MCAWSSMPNCPVVKLSSGYARLWEVNTGISNPPRDTERELTGSVKDKHTNYLLTPTHTNTQANTRQPAGSYQLWDVSDVKGNLYEAPVAPDGNVLAAIAVGVLQANQHLRTFILLHLVNFLLNTTRHPEQQEVYSPPESLWEHRQAWSDLNLQRDINILQLCTYGGRGSVLQLATVCCVYIGIFTTSSNSRLHKCIQPRNSYRQLELCWLHLHSQSRRLSQKSVTLSQF